jgi:hypothetical protein
METVQEAIRTLKRRGRGRPRSTFPRFSPGTHWETFPATPEKPLQIEAPLPGFEDQPPSGRKRLEHAEFGFTVPDQGPTGVRGLVNGAFHGEHDEAAPVPGRPADQGQGSGSAG